MNIYQNIVSAKQQNKKLLAVLIDPEKVSIQNIPSFFKKIHLSITTHIFVGGSTNDNFSTDLVVSEIKKATNLPVILFPGDVTQITNKADGLLFLKLISGRNAEYLIEQQVKAASILKSSNLEIISTGYILIDGGKETAVQRVSNTAPISQTNIELITNTALAGEYSGSKLIYLEAGSGAIKSIDENIISTVAKTISSPCFWPIFPE